VAILDFLFPNYTCLACKSELNAPQNRYICDKCAQDLPVNTEPITFKDTEVTQYFNKAYATFQYADPIVGLILRLKYNAESHVATALAQYMATTLLKQGKGQHSIKQSIRKDEMVLVPVPLCKKRERTRGYNQAELIAKHVSKNVAGAHTLHLPVVTNALMRIRRTSPQKEMNIRERAGNLKDAFAIKNAFAVRDKKVILVDDVFTSGSTVNECARVLVNAGAKEVNVLTIAVAV
jgi:ComF family protein